MDTAFHDSAGANLSPASWPTLGAALAGLGHECGGGCPDLVTELPADVWFVRLFGTSAGSGNPRTLIEVEFAGPPLADARLRELRELLREVNRCVRGDYIQVSARRGRAPAS